jgi:hypothetical protein
MRSGNFFAPTLGNDDEEVSKLDPVTREIRKNGDSLTSRVMVSLTEKTDIKKQLRVSGELSAYLKLRRSIVDTMPLDRQYHQLKSDLVKLDHLIAEKSET